MVVSDTGPERRECESLTVVHVALARVIAENTICDDLLFALVEPPVLSTKLRGSLVWGWWEVEVRDDTDDAGQGTLKGEQPRPTWHAVNATHVKNAVCQELVAVWSAQYLIHWGEASAYGGHDICALI